MIVNKQDPSYVILARKWRPYQFKDMIGQEHVTKILKNSVHTKKIAHGYLFTGTHGVGKTTAARILAKALNCPNIEAGDACGSCEICKEIINGSSMDVIEIDGASNRGINDIRDLREQISYSPMKLKYKVYIIDEVHMLTKEAFNALLKTLEEPPSHVVFIFATTEIRKIPQTILSRIQRFDFKPISQEKIIKRLSYIMQQENLSFQEGSLDLVSQKADGSMRDALSYLDQVITFGDEILQISTVQSVLGIPVDSIFEKLFLSLTKNDIATCFEVTQDCFELGIQPHELLSGLGYFFRNVLFSKQTEMKPSFLSLSKEKFTHFNTLGNTVSDTDLLRYSKGLSDILSELKIVTHPQLSVEIGLFKLCNLTHIEDFNKLLKSFKNKFSEETLNKESDNSNIALPLDSRSLNNKKELPPSETITENSTLEKKEKVLDNSNKKNIPGVDYLENIFKTQTSNTED